MAKVDGITIELRVVPDDRTVELALKILDVWQENNDLEMVELRDGRYQIVSKDGEKDGL